MFFIPSKHCLEDIAINDKTAAVFGNIVKLAVYLFWYLIKYSILF